MTESPAPVPTTAENEAAIFALLDARLSGATICPSDVARHLRSDDWRPLMDPVREVARSMVAGRRLQIMQGGTVVDPSTARGPLRLRRPPSPRED